MQELGLKRIITHPYFNDFTFDYDIALLELEQPAQYSSTVRPICLPEASHTFPTGKAIWVTGWGHTQEGGELAGPAAGGLPHLPLSGRGRLSQGEVDAQLWVKGLEVLLNCLSDLGSSLNSELVSSPVK